MRKFKTTELTAVLLALTWALSWLWAVRGSGHFTFFVMAYFPWLLLFYWGRETKFAWLWFGLILALMVNSATHNMTVMSITVIGMLVLVETVHTAALKRNLAQIKQHVGDVIKFFFKSALIVLPLTIHKLYFSFRYNDEYPQLRVANPEEFIGFTDTFQALWGFNIDKGFLASSWSVGEATVGLGFGILLILCLVIGSALVRRYRRNRASNHPGGELFTYPVLILALLILVLLGLAAGDIFTNSPYSLLRELPIFEGTRVAARWLIFAGLFMLFVIAAYNKEGLQHPMINTLLVLNLLLLGFVGYRYASNIYKYPHNPKPARSDVPVQAARWEAPRELSLEHDDNLYLATKSNIGQIKTNLVPFFDTKFGGTQRCDQLANKDCQFVLNHNANVTYWSPNKIILTRTAAGPLELNMNPSRYWLLNRHFYPFAHVRSAEPHQRFIITDQSQEITLEYSPPGSIGWIDFRL